MALDKTSLDLSRPIYMDNNATTPMDPRVLEAMMPYLTDKFGNAASRNHVFGWEAEEAVEKAREQVAKAIGADAKEIIFTSGATESDNIAIKGAVDMYAEKGNHIITMLTEHKAVLDTCRRLEREGKATVTYLAPKPDGIVDLEQLEAAITDKTIMVAIMMANNEIGVIQPMAEIGEICRKHGVLFFTDAVQSVGKVPVDVNTMKIDVLAISGHKVYGPKGVGALYVRRKNPRVKLTGIIDGGGQERGMRSGTLNVPGIVGLGKALELCIEEMPSEIKRLTYLRNKLKDGVMSQLEDCYVNGSMESRLPGNINISFAYVEGEGLLMGLKGLAVSSGSACTSASLEPSHVLKALGVGDELAHSSIRYGLGRFTTEEEVDYAIQITVEAVNRLREMSPLYEMAKAGIDLKTVQWNHH
ncbi:MAG: IscS subfamily cysteine desulfurase [Chlorobiales bacterium]